ncbi:MAG: hypothetical protein ACYCZB_04040 [Acidiphilium sp.]
MHFRKDISLDKLANVGNVAQFVSFSPARNGPQQEFCRIAGYQPNEMFEGPHEAIAALLATSPEGTVNVRSYAPDSPRSKEFVYGIPSVAEALGAVTRLAGDGLHVIVNETVDVADGGVSGVMLGGLIEFSPDDTPRCVEKPGTASLPLNWGLDLIERVYNVRPDVPLTPGRLEFSVHPVRRGWKRSHTLAWEFEAGAEGPGVAPSLAWPNRFSSLVGDKAYGLLMADAAGLPVPRTLVICRRIAPFEFGTVTGLREKWTRTCPTTPEPGLFTTVRGWCDPFALLAREDPAGDRIASVLSQDAVSAAFSGAALVGGDGRLVIEGVAGEGDSFMLGLKMPQSLPEVISRDVELAYRKATRHFGPVRFEWVHDGSMAWVVQLHRGATDSTSTSIVPGEAANWLRLDTAAGIERLRDVLASVTAGTGIVLVGEVGLTSHVADLLRKSGVPTRLDRRGVATPMPGMLL